MFSQKERFFRWDWLVCNPYQVFFLENFPSAPQFSQIFILRQKQSEGIWDFFVVSSFCAALSFFNSKNILELPQIPISETRWVCYSVEIRRTLLLLPVEWRVNPLEVFTFFLAVVSNLRQKFSVTFFYIFRYAWRSSTHI